MTIFETVKRHIPVREGVQRYGTVLNRQGMALCPFHNDHTPSLYVDAHHFYCYGCGEHGDLVHFLAKLWGIRPYHAAKQLIRDFGLDPNLPPGREMEIPEEHTRQMELERKCVQRLQERRKQLEEWFFLYEPQSQCQEYDPRFVEACRELVTVEHCLDTMLCGSSSERQQTIDLLLSDRGLFPKGAA